MRAQNGCTLKAMRGARDMRRFARHPGRQNRTGLSPPFPRAWALVVVATAGLFGCSPYGGGAFVCQSDTQCSSQGRSGTCQPNGWCSFADTACPSGQRYGSLGGDLSFLCVGQPASGDDGGLTEQRDASLVDASMSAACYGSSSFVRECFMSPPSSALELGTRDINTDPSSSDCNMVVAGGNLDACVISGSSIHIASGRFVTAHGSRPLVLISTSTIVVDGTIDVASHQMGRIGPSANANPCPTGVSATTGDKGAGGGYGASFAGRGGTGGNGEGGGIGGIAPTPAAPAATRGGCPGSNGADTGGSRGSGGGAVHLIAAVSITINGVINASGAGGGGAANTSGAGGGGSGGMIGFDAPVITVAAPAKVFANGGGGGEGGGTGTGRPGEESIDGMAARGGAGGAKDGGDGGDGAQGAAPDGGRGQSNKIGQDGGGGGGGGAIGVIRKLGTLSNAGLISPPAS